MADALEQRTQSIMNANAGRSPVTPPNICAVNPFYELLLPDIRQGLPPQLIKYLNDVQSTEQLYDLLVASRIHKEFSADRNATIAFTRHLLAGGGPMGAAQAMVNTKVEQHILTSKHFSVGVLMEFFQPG